MWLHDVQFEKITIDSWFCSIWGQQQSYLSPQNFTVLLILEYCAVHIGGTQQILGA